MSERINWREVLDCKCPLTTPEQMAEKAIDLKYYFFCHNNRLFKTIDDDRFEKTYEQIKAVEIEP